jgi:hypothetical protein
MMPISLSGISIPLPEPYNSKDPHKQRENFYFVQLQILAAAKAENLTWEELNSSASMTFTLPEIREVIDVLKDIAYQELWQDFGNYRQSLNSRLDESVGGTFL